ncbi:glycosyltransferase [Microbacterium lacticum]|uniref:glycosyltransferase n=1 Tax=Microbacterium lacticum TaxID=33885 RepID=UPI001F55E25D|nr:glycosyltransferase [Microbacterium lacticum]
MRRAVRRAGVVLTVSETSARDIRAWLRDDSVNVVNTGNGCSAAFRVDGPAAPSTDPYVVFVGNMRPHKNLGVVLRALAQLPQLHLRAVLPPGEVAAATVRAEALGVGKRVEWMRGIDDDTLAEIYRGAAAAVMPSIDEGFGLPALEAISCGVPVVFWQGCEAVAEIVGERGWALSSWRDAGEWAFAMQEAVAAPRRVEPPLGLYDWDRTAGTVTEVLRRAMS